MKLLYKINLSHSKFDIVLIICNESWEGNVKLSCGLTHLQKMGAWDKKHVIRKWGPFWCKIGKSPTPLTRKWKIGPFSLKSCSKVDNDAPQLLKWCPSHLHFIAFLLHIGVMPPVNNRGTTIWRRPCICNPRTRISCTVKLTLGKYYILNHSESKYYSVLIVNKKLHELGNAVYIGLPADIMEMALYISKGTTHINYGTMMC